jgi:putative phosphoribosyl transferase
VREPAPPLFFDREAAGEELARELKRLRLHPPVLVLALPRGGLPVAVPIARELGAALDVLVVRKIAMPGDPELAIGAIAPGAVYEPSPLSGRMISPDAMRALVRREQTELERRERLYRAGRPPLDLRRKTVVLVDDGLATGATMLAAVRAARTAGATTVIVAAPVASREALDLVDREASATVILQQPAGFLAVGQFYQRFEQVADAAVCRALASCDAEANAKVTAQSFRRS